MTASSDNGSRHRPSRRTKEEKEGTEGNEERVVHDCPYCDRRFAREEYLALHQGQEHASCVSPDERAAYESAREEERRAVRLFRYKALGALVLVYFGFVIVYAFSL